MLDEIIDNPELEKYHTTFEPGQTIFLEGDDSQDIYILLTGYVDILKGNKKITEISDRGSLFGEMSFLLGAKRTATIKAKTDIKAIRIPEEDVAAFLGRFPDVLREIGKVLAQRLEETSSVLYGLREFCDQLPEAVILTDKDGKILTFNTAAQRLFGRDWDQMSYKPLEEIYEDPQECRLFIDELRERYSPEEKILKIKHPEKGIRFISTSTTLLYDGHHNFQGILFLHRDVTAVQNLERRYRRIRNRLLPSVFLMGLLAVGYFFGYPYLTKGYLPMDMKKQELRNHLAKDYLLLKSLLAKPWGEQDRSKTTQVMKDFFSVQETMEVPYVGLVLLDRDRKVFDAYSPDRREEMRKMIGSSYGGIRFQGGEKSLHKVLTLYRADNGHPMGQKGIEVAFEIGRDKQLSGWLVFQMDMGMIEKTYGLDEEGLKGLRFKRP